MELGNLLAIFAMTEKQQAEYFPRLAAPALFNFGTFDIISESAREIALCALADLSKKGEVSPGKLGELCQEICSISHIIVETSGIWPWMVSHPNDVAGDLTVDPTFYGVWSVVRRLCREAIAEDQMTSNLEPFLPLFSGLLAYESKA